MANSIGIDFGTGNSALAFRHGRDFEVFNGVGNGGIVPSDILKGVGGILTDPALLLNPPTDAVLYEGIKRQLLHSITDPTIDRSLLIELAVARLKYIYDAFVVQYGEPVNAVLTCPANTGQAYRKILLEIGSRVGLPRVDVVDEPTSAAIYHGLHEVGSDDEDWLVVDWGRGTCDVSAIRRTGGAHELEVVHVEGENDLGGLDMDTRLRAYLADRYGFDAESCPLHQIESLKKRLSTDDEVNGVLALLDGTKAKISLTRSELEEVVAPLFERVYDLIRRVMTQVGWNTADRIIATGGPINMPTARRIIVHAVEGEPPEDQDDADSGLSWTDPLISVACGAARLAELKRTGGFAVPTRVTQSIGVRVVKGTHDDVYHRVIQRGEMRPITRTVTLATSVPLQDVIEIEIREGDYEYSAQANTLLGKIRVVVRPENQGAVKVQLRLHLNDAGRLEASTHAIEGMNGVRGADFVGIATESGAVDARSAELRLADPVSEFQTAVMEREVDRDTARQEYERLKIKYHPDRDPQHKAHWHERLRMLDESFIDYQAEIERRIRAASLPDLPWSNTDELKRTVVDEVLTQRLTHCLALKIRDEQDPKSDVKIEWLIKRFPDYRRVVASYLYTLGRNPVLQRLLAADKRVHVGFVVLLQNIPDKTVRERHDVLKAAYRMPESRVRELLADPELDIEALYHIVQLEAPASAAPTFNEQPARATSSPTDKKGDRGLTFTHENGDTCVTGDTHPHKETFKRYGFRWDGDHKRWVARGKHVIEKDVFPDA